LAISFTLIARKSGQESYCNPACALASASREKFLERGTGFEFTRRRRARYRSSQGAIVKTHDPPRFLNTFRAHVRAFVKRIVLHTALQTAIAI
jgi:hypothetical protein